MFTKIDHFHFKTILQVITYSLLSTSSVQCSNFSHVLILFPYYRPQRSWAKVMFLQVSVILLTGGGGCTWSGHGGCTWSGPRGGSWSQGGPDPGRGCTWSQGVYLVWGVPGPGGCLPGTPHPRDQVPPWTRYTPLGPGTPTWDQVHTP